VPRAQAAAAAAAAAARLAGLREVYGSVEPGLSLALAPTPGAAAEGAPKAAAAPRGAAALLRLLLALPHGPVRFSPKMAGLVETRCGGGGGQGAQGRGAVKRGGSQGQQPDVWG
jgi:hypothetical protein